MLSLDKYKSQRVGAHTRSPGKEFTIKASFIALIAVSVSAAILWFGFTLASSVTHIEEQWKKYDEHASIAAHSLGRLKNHFGYGGFIHHFKNYVISKDPSLVNKIELDLQQTYKAINDFPDDNESEQIRLALVQINAVVDQYAKNIDLAQRLVAENRDSAEIDRLVRVDDHPAIESLQLLTDHVFEHSKQHITRTSQDIENTLAFINRSILLLPLIVLVAIIMIAFLRQLIRTHHQLQTTGQYLHDLFDSAPDAMLIVNNKGNITKANSQTVKLFGYTIDELTSMNVTQLIPERFRPTHQTKVENSFRRPSFRPMDKQSEFTALDKNGNEIPVEISINYTLRDDEKFAITTLRDTSERKKTETITKHNKEMLNKAQKIAHIGSWDWGLKNNTLTWSEQMHEIFGLGTEQFGDSYDEFLERLHPQDRDLVVDALNAAVVLHKPVDIEHRIIRPDGLERIVHLRGEGYLNEFGECDHLVGTMHDVTEQRYTEYELRLADNVFNHTTEAIMVTDEENRILRVNRSFSLITGYTAKEALGHNPRELLKSGRHDKAFYKEFWDAINNNGLWEGEIWDRRKNGEVYPTWQNISTVKDEHGKLIQHISIFSDITEKKLTEEHIQNLAQFDQLTNLPNRTLFNDRLQHAIDRATRFKEKIGLMFIDLDRFKSVNDTLGHQAGDLLLREVAQRLTDCVRNQDTVARLGGDEFTIVLEDLRHAEDSAIVAVKVLEALSIPVTIGEHTVTIGGSIGISVFPDDGTDTEVIIKNADMAMYQAKNLGKNRYQFYTNELAKLADVRFHSESRLRHALENDEFELYYQPQVNLLLGELIGAEALIRWNDPEKGVISPNDFIPLAEEMGLIEPIGCWVIRTACRQAKQWLDEGYPPLRVTVNVSGYQITHGSVAETVEQALNETQLPAEYLELEITETFVMEHPEQGIATVNRLRELGVTLAIDDFGTGYSSLSYLKRLSIDRLKIDRSFVMDIPHDTDDSAIVATIITMARNMGLSVIAEGVENKEHIHFLNENGCVEMQGFYFSKPVTAQAFIPLFNTTYPALKQI